jgi:hypothetical protein
MLACLVVISGWVHSYVCSDSLLYTHQSHFLKIYSQTGRAMIHWSGGWPGASFGLVTESHPLTAGYPDSRYFLNSCTHRLGSFGLFHGRIGFNKANSGAPPASMPYTIVVIPDWFAFALTAMSPVVWLRDHRRRGRYVTPGHCASCGYDLRATPDRCPECGASANIGADAGRLELPAAS